MMTPGFEQGPLVQWVAIIIAVIIREGSKFSWRHMCAPERINLGAFAQVPSHSVELATPPTQFKSLPLLLAA